MALKCTAFTALSLTLFFMNPSSHAQPSTSYEHLRPSLEQIYRGDLLQGPEAPFYHGALMYFVTGTSPVDHDTLIQSMSLRSEICVTLGATQDRSCRLVFNIVYRNDTFEPGELSFVLDFLQNKGQVVFASANQCGFVTACP